MKNYIIKRTLMLIPIFLGILLILGILFSALPGDCLSLFIGMDPQEKQALREQMHLNEPKIIQFWYWIKNTLHGNFGYDSWGNDLSVVLKGSFKDSFISYSISFIVSIIISIPLGVLAACNIGKPIDRIIRVFSSLFSCLPDFVVALFVGLFVNYGFKISEVYENTAYLTPHPKTIFKYYLAMILTLTLVICSGFVRYMRTSMLDVANKDYIRTARSKGLKEKIVIYKHALRNALIPVITYMGTTFSTMISASITIEVVLGYSGAAYMMYVAISQRQYGVMLSITSILVTVTLLVNYLVDIMYALIDPRIQYN